MRSWPPRKPHAPPPSNPPQSERRRRQQMRAHPRVRKASWMSSRISQRIRRRRNQCRWANARSTCAQPLPNRRSRHNRNRNSCHDYTTRRDMTRGGVGQSSIPRSGGRWRAQGACAVGCRVSQSTRCSGRRRRGRRGAMWVRCTRCTMASRGRPGTGPVLRHGRGCRSRRTRPAAGGRAHRQPTAPRRPLRKPPDQLQAGARPRHRAEQ